MLRSQSKTIQPALGKTQTRPDQSGFTLIELMIVIAILAILVSMALPVYSNYTIRAKIAEGLSVAAAAKTTTTSTCQEDPNLTGLTNPKAGYAFTPAPDKAYVDDIQVGDDCDAPTITITTKNTGTNGYDPVIVLTATILPGTGNARWSCASSNTPSYLLPKTCRS